ncbi:MAG: hypothetical protein ACQEW8_04505 [Actinomycetota bacterium]
MSATPKDSGGDLPKVLRVLAQMFKDAVNVEWRTDAGRMNLFGMLLGIVLVAILTVAGILQWSVATVSQAFGDGPGPSDMNPMDALYVYLVANLICVAMLGVLVIFARRNDSPHNGS